MASVPQPSGQGGLVDLFLHLDKELENLLKQYGAWTYGILAAVIFAETGLVFCPFLPGDSLLFVVGLLAKRYPEELDVWRISFTLAGAALVGDNVNYQVGRLFGEKLFRNPNSKIFNPKYLKKTHEFYEKYGGKTIIIGRFVPVVRTMAPFVAGMGTMTFKNFIGYSIAGAIIWVGVCVSVGYFFGAIPAIEKNFHWAILAIVALSVIPIAIEFILHKRREKHAAASQSA
ncbi:MAG: DedA family protein [Fimbriimonadaceae bacterium]